MNSDFLSFTADGIHYKIARESKKWNLYAITDDCSNELVLTSWYPGDVLNAATVIQNSNIPYFPPDDDTEDMPPRSRVAAPIDHSGAATAHVTLVPSIWNIQAELKV